MIFIVLVVIGLVVAGVLLFSGGGSPVKKSPATFLEDIRKYTDGTLQSQKGRQQVCFRFDGQDFVFEVARESGFKGDVDQYYLKAVTAGHFSLNFTEKRRKKIVTQDLFMASEVPEDIQAERKELHMPKELKDFDVITSNKAWAQELLEDAKIVRILRRYVVMDGQGRPTVSLNVIEGCLVLRFYHSGPLQPDITDLQKNVPAIEGYAQELLVLIEKLNRLAHG
ncbi:MAG: hypothetical protein KC618_08805 [Candidatus Omnitrophica bacterium]|nr:hypothetical protein [Candidatus Omnitrophota bacterium]